MELQVEAGMYSRVGGDRRMTLRGALAMTRRSLPHAREERARRDAEGNLVRKAGIMAVVLAGGEVRAGDPVRVELPARPHAPLAPV